RPTPRLGSYSPPHSPPPANPPGTEAVPHRKHPLYFGYSPAPDPFRSPPAAPEGLPAPFEMRIAQRPPLRREPAIGRPPVRPDHPRKSRTQERCHHGPTPAAGNLKHGHLAGDHGPQPGPLPGLPPAGLVHIHDGRLRDRSPGFLDDGRQGGTLGLLLAHHRPEGHPDRPQVVQQLPHFPSTQSIAATQQR